MKQKQRHKNIKIGGLIIFLGILMLSPMVALLFYTDEIGYWYAFLIPVIATIVIGLAIIGIGNLVQKLKKNKKPIKDAQLGIQQENIYAQNPQQNYKTISLVVLGIWLYSFLAGSLPFFIAGQLDFVRSLFESVSGWTATGLSAIQDIDKTPKIFLLHRSFMQYCGGVGFVMVILTFVKGRQAMLMYSAEGHTDHIAPSLKKTVRTILIMYVGITILATIIFVLCGMSFFEAFNRAMVTLSTGGFSTTSIEQSNIAVDIFTVLFMFIGMTNFAVLMLLFKGKFKKFAMLSEIRFLGLLLLISIPTVAISLVVQSNFTVDHAFGSSILHIMGGLSTAGYNPDSLLQWSQLAILILICIMLIGGCSGSTSGGLKIYRVYLLCRIGIINLYKKIAPSRKVSSPHYTKLNGKTPLDDATIQETTGFFLLYGFIFLIGTFTLTAIGDYDITESAFNFASSLSTAGFVLGDSLSQASIGTLITLMFGMILGRLEIYIVLIGIYTLFEKSAKGINNLWLTNCRQQKN